MIRTGPLHRAAATLASAGLALGALAGAAGAGATHPAPRAAALVVETSFPSALDDPAATDFLKKFDGLSMES